MEILIRLMAFPSLNSKEKREYLFPVSSIGTVQVPDAKQALVTFTNGDSVSVDLNDYRRLIPELELLNQETGKYRRNKKMPFVLIDLTKGH